ncbi:phosphotransferase enzyme family protein [Kribbella lupini]|uniref:Aminoglycoside phosphotransferase domain-containing protein n=1 Tax=Kribbella lupini TaxID=291602 RepID=A0ABP4N6Z7_9ACTN
MNTPALRDWLLEDYGLRVVELTRVHGGADLAAEVWRADSQSRGGIRSYAVKWSGGGTDAGPLVSAELAGVLGVAGPVRTRAGGLWSVRGGRRLTVAPWVDGESAAAVGVSEEQWAAYGVLLAGVHSVEPSEELRRVLPRLNPVNARMPGLLRDLDARLTGRRGEADAIEAELAELWLGHREAILRLLEAVDQPRGRAVICHADPHLGNVIVGGDGVQLIDWDDAVLAPREQDLMFLLGGMGTLGPTTAVQLDAFFAGYGEVELDRVNLRYYRRARVQEEVGLWAEQVITGPDREQALEILRGVLGPGGLLRVADPDVGLGVGADAVGDGEGREAGGDGVGPV